MDGDQFNQGLLQRSREDSLDKDNRSLPGSPTHESSDDEAQSMSPVEDYTIQDLATSSTVTLQYNTMMDSNRRNSISGSSHSLHSDQSDPDISDMSPGHTSPTFPNMAIVSIQSDEIEDVWRSHVHRIMTDHSATYAVNTFHLFARLFQVGHFSFINHLYKTF